VAEYIPTPTASLDPMRTMSLYDMQGGLCNNEILSNNNDEYLNSTRNKGFCASKHGFPAMNSNYFKLNKDTIIK
jgi:hypothetical protein